jgi:hypothetical protein
VLNTASSKVVIEDSERKAFWEAVKNMKIGEVVELPSPMPALSKEPSVAVLIKIEPGSKVKFTFNVTWFGIQFADLQISRFGDGYVLCTEVR